MKKKTKNIWTLQIISVPLRLLILCLTKNMKDQMKKNQSVFFVAALSGMVTLCSCAKEVLNDKEMLCDSHLTVLTRSDGENGNQEIATPLHFYVFNDEEQCVATRTLESSDTPISVELPQGNYDVYAIGGADENLMTLPAQDDAEKSSVIRLREGKDFGDLMTSHAAVTLLPKGSNTLSLGMERKVCQITGVSIKGIPDAAKAVSVCISPFYESILLNGRYEGENGTCMIPLARQADNGTWTATGGIYQLPSVSKPTISITIDNTTYSYTCEEEMAANYKISINGTYTGQDGLSDILLSGTVTGVSWSGEQTISFNFNEHGSETNNADEDDNNDDYTEDGVINKPVPEVGTFYQGCYVLAVNGKQATVLSSKETTNLVKIEDSFAIRLQKVINVLKDWSVPNISANWELPNKDLIEKIVANADYIVPALDKVCYFYINKNNIDAFSIKNGQVNDINAPTDITYLRPVATLTFK